MIRGVIRGINVYKDNDWGVFDLECDGKDIRAAGVIHDASVGMIVVVEGTSYRHPVYGEQFNIKEVLSTEADPYAGIRRFFYDGYVKWIGQKKADAIISIFGDKSGEMFETEEGRKKLTEAKGVTKKLVDKAYKSYIENKKYMGILMFLKGAGTRHQVEQIYETYKDDALKILKKNPYRLQTDIDGIGFLKADKIALGAGIRLNSEYRLMAAASYVLEDEQQKHGHCYLTRQELTDLVIPILAPNPKCDDISDIIVSNALVDWAANKEKLIKAHNPSPETIKKLSDIATVRNEILSGFSDAIGHAIDDGKLTESGDRLYTTTMYKTEMGTAEAMARMAGQKPVRNVSEKTIDDAVAEVSRRKTAELSAAGIDTGFEATEEQINAVKLGLKNRLSIISGGPGRGKTAICEIIADAFIRASKYGDKSDIIMLAPTGRAAQRIKESTGYSAMTAHMAIARAGLHKKDSGASGELPEGKLVICDETSMVDIFLMRNILRYAEKCQIIFVGDVDQIASVGPGKVLRDMIDSKRIPCILLKQGHRNSGSIAHNADLINNGYGVNYYTYDRHFVYIPADIDKIQDVLIHDYILKAREYGKDQVMLCTAMRERGKVSVNALNKRLQTYYCKDRKKADFGNGRIFYEGDRVMQTKNDYGFVKLVEGKQTEGVFNGERGTVIRVQFGVNKEGTTEPRLVVRFDDGTLGGYTPNTIANLTLAYATTLHKCQGSEAACMMMAYTYGDYLLLNRSLFYTGETRAKKEFRFYGEEQFKYGKQLSAFDIAVSHVNDEKRNTGLCEMIADFVDHPEKIKNNNTSVPAKPEQITMFFNDADLQAVKPEEKHDVVTKIPAKGHYTPLTEFTPSESPEFDNAVGIF